MPMQRRTIVTLILTSLILSALPAQSETSGRAGDNCAQVNLSSISTAVAIDDGNCVVVPLGELTPQSVWSADLLIIDDEIDVFFFDAQGIIPYDLDQSYRSSYQSAPSTEFAIGEYEFDWMIPASISSKTWYLVLDNKAHPGDQGEGDQGGNRSTASFQFTQINQQPNTLFHDLVELDSNQSTTIIGGDELRLDTGTSIQITVDSLEGSADLLVQTESIHNAWNEQSSASASISGQSILNIQGQSTLLWTVTEDYSDQPLYVVLDNSDRPSAGAQEVPRSRTTVEISLTPVVNAAIASTTSSVVLGEQLDFDAQSSANLSGQIASYDWDFDASNGVLYNDANGITASNSWDVPGNYTVSLQITANDGRASEDTVVITVSDVTNPNPVITQSGSGNPVSEGYILNVGDAMSLSCASSTDDHQIKSCSWLINGNNAGQEDQVFFNYSTVVDWDVELTVEDMSGNTAKLSTIVKVIDTSSPVLSSASTSTLTKIVTAGEEVTFTMTATDSFDSESVLRYHWDLDATRDDDANGNKLDDPDFTGQSFTTTFDKTGKFDLTVTVFDASNNSDSYSWRVTVQNSASVSNLNQILPAVGAIAGLILVIGLISRIRKRSRSRPVVEQDTRTQDEILEEQKRAQMEAIYGAQQQQQYSQSVSGQMSQASFAAVSSAANDLFTQRPESNTPYASTQGNDLLTALEESSPEQKEFFTPQPAQDVSKTLEEKTATTTSVNRTALQSSGVSLPENLGEKDQEESQVVSQDKSTKGEPVKKVHECTDCSKIFAVRIPVGILKVKAKCPSCGSSQIISS